MFMGADVYKHCSHRGSKVRVQATFIRIYRKPIPTSKQNREFYVWTPDRLKYMRSPYIHNRQLTSYHCASGDVLKLITAEVTQ